MAFVKPFGAFFEKKRQKYGFACTSVGIKSNGGENLQNLPFLLG